MVTGCFSVLWDPSQCHRIIQAGKVLRRCLVKPAAHSGVNTKFRPGLCSFRYSTFQRFVSLCVPVPVFDCLHRERSFLYVRSQPLLLQFMSPVFLPRISVPPIFWRTSVSGQPQLLQPFLTQQVLCSPEGLSSPPLNSLGFICVLLVLECSKLHMVFQVGVETAKRQGVMGSLLMQAVLLLGQPSIVLACTTARADLCLACCPTCVTFGVCMYLYVTHTTVVSHLLPCISEKSLLDMYVSTYLGDTYTHGSNHTFCSTEQ